MVGWVIGIVSSEELGEKLLEFFCYFVPYLISECIYVRFWRKTFLEDVLNWTDKQQLYFQRNTYRPHRTDSKIFD